jgi:hypothetical protein
VFYFFIWSVVFICKTSPQLNFFLETLLASLGVGMDATIFTFHNLDERYVTQIINCTLLQIFAANQKLNYNLSHVFHCFLHFSLGFFVKILFRM